MDICDLHCDTAYEMWRRGESFGSGSLDITAEQIGKFSKYVQLAAFCAPKNMTDDEAYDCFFSVHDKFVRETEAYGYRICRTPSELAASVNDGIPAFVMTVEDARIIGCDAARLHRIYDAGVRVVTPLWGGETVIGGSYETDAGLTDAGKKLMELCAQFGIITDISHSSYRSADDILNIAAKHGKPVMASHSCAYSVNPHMRNIHDCHIRAIADSGGIIGVNMYPPHLTGEKTATLRDVLHHIRYITDMTGEDTAALGCDFDGMDVHAIGAENVSCLDDLQKMLVSEGIRDDIIRKIFFKNAFNFLVNHL